MGNCEFDIKNEVLLKYLGDEDSVIIPEGIVEISDKVFENCQNLICITLPKSIKKIKKDAFWGCDSAVNIFYNGSEKEWDEIDIEEGNETLSLFDIYCYFGKEGYRLIHEYSGNVRKIIHEINIEDIPRNELDIDIVEEDYYKFEGVVFDKEIKTFSTTDAKLIFLGITNYKDSIAVKKWTKNEKIYVDNIEIGSKVEVVGKIVYDVFLNDVIVLPNSISNLGIEKSVTKLDDAPIKRVELHAHTNASKLDGLNTVYDYLNYANQSGLKAIAITDTNSVQNFPEIVRANREADDFKFIYGVELSLCNDEKSEYFTPIVILLKNKNGLNNLYRIISSAINNEIQGQPRIYKSVLDKYREGILIGLCFSNLNSLNYNYDYLEKVISCFDYIELTSLDDYCDYSLVEQAIYIAKKHNKLVVAAANCRYIDSQYHMYHKMFKNEDKPLMHLRTTDEMLEAFSFLGNDLAYEIVVTNTNIIADQIEKVDIVPKCMLLPKDDELKDSIFKIPSIKEELIRLTNNSLISLYGDKPDKLIVERYNFELNSIINNNYQFYYYILYKIVQKAHLDGEVVGSRGMIASSFIARLLDITELNPLPAHYRCKKCKYHSFDVTVDSGFDLEDAVCPICGEKLIKDGQNLPVESFMGTNGEKVPDLDLNFSDDYKPRVYEYLKSILGEDRVIIDSIFSFTSKMNAFGYVKRYFEGKVMPRNIEMERLSLYLLNTVRSNRKHPGGIIYIPKEYDAYDYTPIYELENEFGYKEKISHIVGLSWHINVVKFDILDYDDPKVIKYLMDYVHKYPNEFPFDNPYDIPVDDKIVYKLFNSTDIINLTTKELGYNNSSLGISEFNDDYIRKMLDLTKPACFEELVKISGFIHGTSVWYKNGESLLLDENKFDKITLKQLIACREDIMLNLIDNGIDKSIAYEIMECVRKGKAREYNSKWCDYKQIMEKHNIPEWFISSCEKIGYIFPKSHVAVYVYIALKIAWFKLYSPAAFYGAWFSHVCTSYDSQLLLSRVDEIRDKILSIKEKEGAITKSDKDLLLSLEVAIEAKLRGINFLPSDKNKSSELFEVEDGNVRLPKRDLVL